MSDKPALPEGSTAIDPRVVLQEFAAEAAAAQTHLRSRNLLLAQENANLKAEIETVKAEIAGLRSMIEGAAAVDAEVEE